MDFFDYPSRAGFLDPTDPSLDHHARRMNLVSSEMAPSVYYNTNMTAAMSCDIKPRLTKEQHDILEAHFQKQNKPNTNTKKAFAESLNVSLDKVNVSRSLEQSLIRDGVTKTAQQNWFQNRRAKSKQDAKKQQDALNASRPQQESRPSDWSSDAEISPAYSSSDYLSMMQQYGTDEPPVPMSMPHPQQVHADTPFETMHYGGLNGQYADFTVPQMPQIPYDTSQELNRRTLTQEQFDAIAQSGDMMPGDAAYNFFQPVLSDDVHLTGSGFALPGDLKQHDLFNSLPASLGAPMSSHDSTIPSNMSEQSFPSTLQMHERASVSTSGSDWTDSRCSSVVGMQPEGAIAHQPPGPPTFQWQPGQSVPVDFKALNEQFQQAAQARHTHSHEQPLAFPADEAFIRRDSQSSMLAQSMSHVGIHAAQPQPDEAFKSPAPPSSIAARRQRPRPAALGLASLRSQSYSGATQPNSPSHAQQNGTASGQPLRRIRSSNVVGGIAQGRVQKVPGGAQRSPLSWTFAESLKSPKVIRHVSQSTAGNLAPPTPLSPPDFLRPEHPRAVNPWQTSSGHVSRQPSISEHDSEQGGPFVPQVSALPPQKFCSPPQTPMYYQQQFVQQRMANNYHLENTPPQSAPASQQCFQNNYLPPHMAQSQAALQQQVMAYGSGQPQQLVGVMAPEQYVPIPTVAYAPVQHFAGPTIASTCDIPMQFPHGVPTITADGQLQMAFPQQLQLDQQQMSPPQPHIPQSSTAESSPDSIPMRPTPSEFEFHEYTPSEAIKRMAGPHRAVDTGPKNYTFANQGPEHFDKAKRNESKTSATATDCPA